MRINQETKFYLEELEEKYLQNWSNFDKFSTRLDILFTNEIDIKSHLNVSITRVKIRIELLS